MTDLNKIKVQKEVKAKLQAGDFTTLGAMLNIQGEAARKRFNRLDEDAILGAQKIVKAREELINKSQTK